MDQAELRRVESRCTQESMPQCRAHCPLRLDVRAFMERMAEGQMRDARKLLERHLPLPEIMARICDHPCEDHCLRRDLGGSLSIASLESLCVDSVPQQSKSFPRPPKGQSVAILGNGLAGLVVAFELSRKAWPVTIFHEGPPEAVLLRHFPALHKDHLRGEWAGLLKAGCTFEQKELHPSLLEYLAHDFAAIFVDAAAAPQIFASLPCPPDAATGLVTDTMCAGGMLAQSPTGALYPSSSAQAGQGRRAATTLERVLAKVSLTAERENEMLTHSPLCTDISAISPVEAIMPKGESFTQEEGMQEAARCIRCQCLACVRQCVYLQKYGSYPRVYARQIYNNASIVKGEHQANALVNGCMLCGQCTELCPERFSMAEVCLQAREDMVERNYMPPSAHEFALEDMHSACSSECALTLPAPQGRKTTLALFPGCQLAASRGKEVLGILNFLRISLPNEGVGLFLSCCGVPAHWAGNKEAFQLMRQSMRSSWEHMGRPRLVVACASCAKTMREHMPEISTVSLWDVLRTYYAQSGTEAPVSSASKSMVCTVHDPCSARHDTAWQKSVRALARLADIEVHEAAKHGKETACCGYGGLVWCAQPELAKAATLQKAGKARHTGLASCIMCRDRMVSQGMECLHLVDVLPFLHSQEETEARLSLAAKAPPPGLSARRAGRAALKCEAMRQDGVENEKPQSSQRIDISPSLLAALECRHILRQDVVECLLAVELSGKRFQEKDSGHYVGSYRPRNVTFWVRYSQDGEGFILHNAWCHRMRVPGTGGKES